MKSVEFMFMLKIVSLSQYLDHVVGYQKRSVAQSGSCGAGHYTDRSTNTCKPCPAATFMTEEMSRNQNYRTCRRCYAIQQHEKVQKGCTPTQDTVVVCEKGYFMAYQDSEKAYFTCDPCWRCGLGVNQNRPHEARACSPVGNTVCCEDRSMGLHNGQCVRAHGTPTPSTQATEVTATRSRRLVFTQTSTGGWTEKQECVNNSYGENCDFKCSDFCQPTNASSRSECDRVNGRCLFGCLSGYRGNNCTEKCPRKTHGQGCLLNCSQNCLEKDDDLDDVCHHINGKCLNGCQLGYDGDFCNIKSNLSSASIFFKYGLGLGCGLLLVLVILFVTACKLERRRHRGKTRENVYNGTFVINDDHHEYVVPHSLALDVSEDRCKEKALVTDNESQYISIDEDFIYAEVLTLKSEDISTL